MKQLTIIYLTLIFLTACTVKTTDAPVRQTSSASVTVCKEPRSPMCTREYNPVCATKDTGVRCVTTPCPSTELKTYATACTACADEKVISYTAGKCAEEQNNESCAKIPFFD